MMIKRRIQNVKGYQKRRSSCKVKRPASVASQAAEPGEKDYKTLTSDLVKELKSKKPNKAAVKELQIDGLLKNETWQSVD